MRATLIHNPSAGEGGHGAEELLAELHSAGIFATAYTRKSDAIGQALTDPGALVVIAGGDGTVADVLKDLPRRDVAVGILPLGTANNIARSFGIAGEPSSLMAGWRNAARRELRVGVAQGSWGTQRFVEGVGFGALAQMAAEQSARPEPSTQRLRQGRAWLHAILRDAVPAALTLEADGQAVEGPFLLAEVLNIACIGPNLCLAPGADPADAMLDIVVVTPAERTAMLAWLLGGTDGPPPVRRLAARRVRVEWQGVPLHVDDEFPEEEAGRCDLQLEEQPITVLVPDGTQR
jgi:diacylglycerol kinase family enzyme